MSVPKRYGLASLLGSAGAGLMKNPAGQAVADQASNMAQAEEMKRLEEEEKKKKKSGLLGKLGSVGGAVLGSAIPGVGTAVGAGLGSAVGGTAGQAIGGGGIDPTQTLAYGLQGAMGGMAGQQMQGMMGGGQAAAAPAAGMDKAMMPTPGMPTPATGMGPGQPLAGGGQPMPLVPSGATEPMMSGAQQNAAAMNHMGAKDVVTQPRTSFLQNVMDRGGHTAQAMLGGGGMGGMMGGGMMGGMGQQQQPIYDPQTGRYIYR